MKTWILAMAMIMGVAANAQEKRERREHFKPEQRAELQAKKMTLALDLNDKQQKEVEKLFVEKNKERQLAKENYKAQRKAGKKLTTDEKFAMRSRMLDDRIAMKSEMKKILTQEQLDKLSKMKKGNHHKLTKRNKNFKNPNKR
jgi:hypothetical protein